MRRIALFLVAVVAAFIAFVLWTSADTDTSTTDSATDTDAPPAIGSDDEPRPAANQAGNVSVAPSPPATARPGIIVHYDDGDSFELVWDDQDDIDEVRLVGINAPERDACFGRTARDVLIELVADRPILIDGVERDEFGRLLANVWVEDVFINLAMVQSGAALAITGDGDFAERIAIAQLSAEANQVGLWSPDECGAASTDLRIAAIEYNPPGPDNERANEEWIEITNTGAEPVSLAGYSLRDESTRNRFAFPNDFVLDSQGIVRVRSGCGQDTSGDLYWCAQDPVWNNGGDTAFLVNPDGQFVDTFSYAG